MPITHLDLAQLLASTGQRDFGARRKLEEVSVAIAKAKKVIVVTGAGISCSSGIPDFRSADGLYSLVKRRYPDAFVTGRDLFSAGLFLNPNTTSIFLTFIAELSLACQKATPTRTHHFIHKLDRSGKLLRSYTQNVDGFERRMGMESGGRGKGLHKKTTRNVELHGDLGRVRCTLCFTDYEAKGEWVGMMREGEAPECPMCHERCSARLKRSARATPIGSLRPSIVLYDEPHPLGDDIGLLQSHDVARTPDVLIIMGTSLKVTGLKALVKDFAKAVHAAKKPGMVVFVNATRPGKEWEGVIDVHVQGETDAWVEKVEEVWKRVKPADWEVQTKLDLGVLGPGSAVKEGKGKGNAKPHADGPSSSRLPPVSPDASCAASSPLSSLSPPPPLSPSKRRNMPTPDPTPSPKKPRAAAPSTGITASPGRGNLFAIPASQESVMLASQSLAMDDEDEGMDAAENAEAEHEVEEVDELDESEDEVDELDEDEEQEDEVDDEVEFVGMTPSPVARARPKVSIPPGRASRAQSRQSSRAPAFHFALTAAAASQSTKAASSSSTSMSRYKGASYTIDKPVRPASRSSLRNKENAPPPSYASLDTKVPAGPLAASSDRSHIPASQVKMGARKAKMPGSPLKAAPRTRSRAEGAVMGVRRSNRA